MSHPTPDGVLVSDFDGTLCRKDFFQLVVESLLPADAPDYWGDYLAGRRTHFETLRVIFGSVRADEAAWLGLVGRMELDPRLAESLAALRGAGWEVVVASAGCDWYIRRLLAGAGVALEVHANPGRLEPGGGLRMELPAGSRYLSPTHGIDKAAVVRAAAATGRRVAFAGDGFSDAPAARLVPPGLRFARANLAAALRAEGLPFRPFERWSEVAAALVALG
jgi:2,3-diketo-5-methylthio-1-phosphopentane phosphatase